MWSLILRSVWEMVCTVPRYVHFYCVLWNGVYAEAVRRLEVSHHPCSYGMGNIGWIDPGAVWRLGTLCHMPVQILVDFTYWGTYNVWRTLVYGFVFIPRSIRGHLEVKRRRDHMEWENKLRTSIKSQSATDSSCSWLETLKDMAESHAWWRSFRYSNSNWSKNVLLSSLEDKSSFPT